MKRLRALPCLFVLVPLLLGTDREPTRPAEGTDIIVQTPDRQQPRQVDQTDGSNRAEIALTIRSPFSPYESVRYELKVRGNTLITTLTKTLVQQYGELQGLGLVPWEALTSIRERLEGCRLEHVTELDSEDEQAGSETEWGWLDPSIYELHLQLDPLDFHQTRLGARLLPDSPFLCATQVLIDTYEQYGEPVPFRNLFFDPGEYGELSTDSTPPARVFIDGVDTGLETPIRTLPLTPGIHYIRFVNTNLGIDRMYDVTIEEGLTTRLDVLLR